MIIFYKGLYYNLNCAYKFNINPKTIVDGKEHESIDIYFNESENIKIDGIADPTTFGIVNHFIKANLKNSDS